MWPEEAAEVLAAGRSLGTLPGVGANLAGQIRHWIESARRVEPPPVRAEFLTLARARKILARASRFRAALRGDLQMHTTWSDGAGSIPEMVAAAVERKYEYIAITDHTQGLSIAHGLDEKRLAGQGREIAVFNQALRKNDIAFTILRSAEMNLSVTGEGDMKSSALAKLDVVLGCFHSGLRTREDQTSRYLAGIRNADIQILGHPQTRKFNRREGLQADWARVFAEAAGLEKAVEIDGYADRQDLRLSLLKIARREGVRISLGTDAHHPEQLAFMELSLAAAFLAKIPAERIVNFLPVTELKEWVRKVRDGAG